MDKLIKEKIVNRQEANREIIKYLSYKIEKYPDIRFGQLLVCLNIIPDQLVFADESVDILSRVKSKLESNK